MPTLATKPSRKLRLTAAVKRRPQVPFVVASEMLDTMAPDADFVHWIRETFLAEAAPLFNEDHVHLNDARIGVLWTNAANVSRGRTIMATAEIPGTQSGGWKRTRHDLQIRQWFGDDVDFLLTFSTEQCAPLSDRAFCALVEHELYHCAQQVDQGGNPKFHRETGLPLFRIVGHDVEEFVGVVRRYGATSADVRALVLAANLSPDFDDMTVEFACGVCAEKAA